MPVEFYLLNLIAGFSLLSLSASEAGIIHA